MEAPQQEVAPPARKSRASSSEEARIYRKKGHDDALEFALAIGLTHDYKNDPAAKKDVIDPSGDGHSVKSGRAKWQMFLYGETRFTKDVGWATMNGVGATLLECLNAFPKSFDAYQRDKTSAKERLRVPMIKLKDKFQNKMLLKAFLGKSIFEGTQVSYLTIKNNEIFHVFSREDVLKAMCDNFEVCNSRVVAVGNFPEQKVLFRYKSLNVGELEMRNDSRGHYQEVRFNMIKPRIMPLLFGKIPMTMKYSNRVLVYGQAGKTFGRWKKAKP